MTISMLAYANRFFLYQNLNRPKTKVKLSRSIFEVHCSAQFWWDNKKWRQFRVRMSIGQHSSHFPLNFQSCKISQPSSTSSISAVKSVKWNIIIQPKISYHARSKYTSIVSGLVMCEPQVFGLQVEHFSASAMKYLVCY